MKTLQTIIYSRTIWTLVVMFLLGGFQAITQYLPQDLYIFITGGLVLIAGYFKLNPSQKY